MTIELSPCEVQLLIEELEAQDRVVRALTLCEMEERPISETYTEDELDEAGAARSSVWA